MKTSTGRKETERLQALSKYEILDSPPEPAFDDLTALAADVCEAPISLLTFLDGQREWFKSKIGVPFAELPRDEALGAYTIDEAGLLVVPDASRDARFAENPLVTGALHIRFYAGFPLISADGHALGALCVLDSKPHDLSSRKRRLLRRLAHEASMLLELRKETRENLHRNEEQSVELKALEAKLAAEAAEHLRTEKDLSKRERQLADSQRLAHLGSWEWEIQTDFVSWSDELYRIFGLHAGEFVATYQGYLQYIHPDDRAETNEIIKKALQTAGSFTHETRIIRADGATRILYTSGQVMRDDQQHPVRMVGCCLDITARKEMDHKLEASVSLLHSTLESTADGILVVDLEGQLLQYNQKFLEMWHLPSELMAGYQDQLVLQRVTEQLKYPDAFLARVRELYQDTEADSFDVLKFKDGRTFERYSRPQRIGKQIVGRVWSFRDVTERCEALETLHRSEERYRSLIIATAQVVWTAAPDGNVIEDHPAWSRFTGQTKDELMGKGWLNAVHPEDQARIDREWSKAAATGVLYYAEYRLRRMDGEWRHMLVRGVPVREEDGTIREWVGFCLDITDRKRAEQTLINERDFSDAIINSMPGIVYLLDETGLNLRWNKNLETVFEYSGEEIKRMRAVDFVVDEDRKLVAERVAEVFERGEAVVEIMSVSKTGRRLPYFCTGKRVYLGGKPRLIGMGIDISDRKKAEEEVKKLNQQLENRVQERTIQLREINKELQAFSYTVSHDLKAPLRAILGFAGAIKENGSDQLDDEHRQFLDRIMKAALRMTRLIEDLLNYSRMGQTAVHLRAIQLNEVLRDIIPDFKLQMEAIGGQFEISPDLPRVKADPSLLNQVFSNFFQNAILYRKPDVPLKISISSRRNEDFFVIYVTDNGIGIAQPHYEKIFEVFQRLRADDTFPGTGIGLANVKKAVELQEGSVWVDSELGKGSTFCVRLRSAL